MPHVAAAAEVAVGFVDPRGDGLAAEPAQRQGVDVGHAPGVGDTFRFVANGGGVGAGVEVAEGFFADGFLSGHRRPPVSPAVWAVWSLLAMASAQTLWQGSWSSLRMSAGRPHRTQGRSGPIESRRQS